MVTNSQLLVSLKKISRLALLFSHYDNSYFMDFSYFKVKFIEKHGFIKHYFRLCFPIEFIH